MTRVPKSSLFAGAGRPDPRWSSELDHALLEIRAAHPGDTYAFWADVAAALADQTGAVFTRDQVYRRWHAIIHQMDLDLALIRARINMADEEAARALTPPPVTVAPSWAGLNLPSRASIAPSQQRKPA